MTRGRKKTLKTTKIAESLTRRQKAVIQIAPFLDALKFEKLMDLDDWSDKYRYLASETSHEYGRWHTSRFPFLRRIMKCLSPSSIASEIVVMKGSQLGFTELSICWMLYTVHCDPGPMAYLQHTDDNVKDFSNQKLMPNIKVCDAVSDLIGENSPIGYSNSVLKKGFPGGFLAMGSANNTGFLKSKSLKKASMDEEDEYEVVINNQGSPRKILDRRLTNFPGSKLYRLSTPVLDELSTIKPGFFEGSQEQYYVPCPNCNPKGKHDGFMFLIEWDTIRYSKEIDIKTGDPVHTWCECPACGGDIEEAQHKDWMLANGDWFSTKNHEEPESPLPRYKVGDVKRPSFRIPSFYSPYGFFSWADAVHDWHEYLRTRLTQPAQAVGLLQVIINQTRAETFTLTGGDIDYSGLYGRRENYAGNLGDFKVPHGALCLTAGADVQDDRIEVEIVAWGIGEESWSVDYAVFTGDTAKLGNAYGMLPDGRPTVWRLLDEYLLKKWKHETGAMMPVEMTMIDCGHLTDEVHKFCKPREHRNVYPLKGQSGWGNGLWRRATRRHEKYGTIDYRGFTDELKTKVYALLSITEVGPGYCHFPKTDVYSEKHFQGMTCEQRKVKYVSGQKKLYWHTPSGARNEPLDCRDYAYVGFSSYNVNMEYRARLGIDKIFSENFAAPQRKRRRGSPGL